MPNLTRAQKDAICNWWRAEPKTSEGFLFHGRLKFYASTLCVSVRTLQNVIQRYKASRTGPSDPPHNMNYRLGRCGVNNSKLTQEKCQAMRSIAQEYLNDHIHCTDRLLREGMEEAGFKHPLSVIQH